MALEEFIADFLHLERTALVLVEVNLIFVDLVLRMTFVTFKSQLLPDLADAVSQLETFLVAGEAREALNLFTFQAVAGVVEEVEKESAFHAVHFGFGIEFDENS